MHKVVNIDGDTDERFLTLEADGESLVSVLARTFSASRHPATSVPRRLLTDVEAAEYLRISRSNVRTLVANGALRRVVMPSTDGRGRAARLLRLDVRDLDAFIEKSKG